MFLLELNKTMKTKYMHPMNWHLVAAMMGLGLITKKNLETRFLIMINVNSPHNLDYNNENTHNVLVQAKLSPDEK